MININENNIEEFKNYLRENERSKATISKYLHDVNVFVEYIKDKECNKDNVIKYKELLSSKYALTSVNSMLAALNTFLCFLDNKDLCVKQYKIQKQTYISENKELTKEEYIRLVKTAEENNNKRLSLIIQTICGTGIRVSELKYITVEALQNSRAKVSCKGKTRIVFIVKDLKRKLIKYIKKNKIESGSVFVTKSGKPIDRCNIWRDMKGLCKRANVLADKVFPHNLRHLFARTFYKIEKDIAKLADILGHSSINTTRIYIMTTGVEYIKRIESMHMII